MAGAAPGSLPERCGADLLFAARPAAFFAAAAFRTLEGADFAPGLETLVLLDFFFVLIIPSLRPIQESMPIQGSLSLCIRRGGGENT